MGRRHRRSSGQLCGDGESGWALEVRRDIVHREARPAACALFARARLTDMGDRNSRLDTPCQRREGREERRHARAWMKPWALAAVACWGSYALLLAFGAGRFRSEFLGISLVLGAIGAILLVGFRIFRGPVWLHGLGVFCLNWLFAAYLVAFLAV